jgi:hypothetical protein
MPNISKLEEALPEGLSYDNLKSVLSEAGYDIVPKTEVMVEIEATEIMPGDDEEKPEEKDDEEKPEEKDDDYGDKPPFMKASQGDRLDRVKKFMKGEGL